MMLRQILYMSTATDTLTFSNLLLQDILDVSLHKNRLLEITGCLIYQNGKFMQVIEGPYENVSRLMDWILKDSRHTEITILLDHLIEKRDFPSWLMALKNITDYPEFLNKSNVFAEDILEKNNSKVTIELLKEFIEK